MGVAMYEGFMESNVCNVLHKKCFHYNFVKYAFFEC